MNTAVVHLAPAKVARITGGLYVAYILASVLATALGQIGLGTPPQVSSPGSPGRGIVRARHNSLPVALSSPTIARASGPAATTTTSPARIGLDDDPH